MSLVQQASIVNPQNAHFRDPGMSSKVGAVAGCGAGDSALSLQQKGLYQMFKTGGRGKNTRQKSNRKRKYKGGNGYGFSKDQVIAGTSGVNGNGSVHLAGFSRYQNTGQNAITNMNASKQSGGNSSGLFIWNWRLSILFLQTITWRKSFCICWFRISSYF